MVSLRNEIGNQTDLSWRSSVETVDKVGTHMSFFSPFSFSFEFRVLVGGASVVLKICNTTLDLIR